MPRKTRRELHESYTERLQSSRRWREFEGYDDTWMRLIDLYRGRHWPMRWRPAGASQDERREMTQHVAQASYVSH